MSAVPEDISLYIEDGLLIQSPPAAQSAALQALFINARTPTAEFDTFFDNVADAQAMLDEKFLYLGQYGQAHLAIELQDAFDIGTAIAIAPTVPTFMVIDEENGLYALTRLRSYAHDFDGDRYAIEVYA